MASVIRTQIFRTGPMSYITVAAELWLGRYWWLLAIPVVACMALGMAVNPAFLFVGFMLAMVCAPMILMFLFYAHALTPEARIAVLPHSVGVSPAGGVSVEFAPDGMAEPPAPVSIPLSEVTGVEYSGSHLMIHLSGRRYRFLIVPYSAFETPEAQQAFGAALSPGASVELPQ